MKKNQTKYAVNNQEDEDSGVYVLYAENAIVNTKQQKPLQLQNESLKIVSKKKAYTLNQIHG